MTWLDGRVQIRVVRLYGRIRLKKGNSYGILSNRWLFGYRERGESGTCMIFRRKTLKMREREKKDVVSGSWLFL